MKIISKNKQLEAYENLVEIEQLTSDLIRSISDEKLNLQLLFEIQSHLYTNITSLILITNGLKGVKEYREYLFKLAQFYEEGQDKVV